MTKLPMEKAAKDFIHKLSIAAKEMRETSGWLKFMIKYQLVPVEQVEPVLDECLQLRKMLGRSLQTARKRRPPPDTGTISEADE